MHAVGAERHLPAEPRAGVDADVLERQSQKPRCHLLARCDHHVVFARVMEPARLAGPGHELVGYASHGRNDNGHLAAGVDFPFHALSRGFDARNVGYRGAAEFLHDARHQPSSPRG